MRKGGFYFRLPPSAGARNQQHPRRVVVILLEPVRPADQLLARAILLGDVPERLPRRHAPQDEGGRALLLCGLAEFRAADGVELRLFAPHHVHLHRDVQFAPARGRSALRLAAAGEDRVRRGAHRGAHLRRSLGADG